MGISEATFKKIGSILRNSKAVDYSTDIAVHGSRASGTATAMSDLDIAIRVTPERFNKILDVSFKNVNEGSSAWKTMQNAIKTGKIQRGEIGLRSVGVEIENLLNLPSGKAQISVIKIGGPFDGGPYIQVPW